MVRFILCYLAAINVATFVVYGIDKWKAKKNRWRVPEASLLWLAAAGGSIGALAAMKLFRHKTLHKAFAIGVPLMLVVQIFLAVYFVWQ